MTEFRNRRITDYWTLVLPSGWSESDREGKPGLGFESKDSTKKIIINTHSCDEGTTQDPPAVLTEFEASVRQAKEKILGKSYTEILAQRSSEGAYLTSTIAGFDATSRMGIVARKYVSPSVAILIQVHDYDSEGFPAFNSAWRRMLGDFSPIQEEPIQRGTDNDGAAPHRV